MWLYKKEGTPSSNAEASYNRGGERAKGGGVFNNRGIIHPVMALTTAQRPPGRDQSR